MAATAPPTDPQERALWDAFQKFDFNGDGKIQSQEFTKLMTSLGSFSPKEIQRLFNEADTDNSNTVDWREFIKWICSGRATKGMKAEVAASFSRLVMRETKDEANFVEEANVSHQVTEYLKEKDRDKSAFEEQNNLKKKLNKTKKAMQQQQQGGTNGANRAPVVGDDLGIGDNYKGFRLPLPVTKEGAEALMNHYLLHGESEPLHPKYVAYLTTEFTAQYKARFPKPVVHTDTPKPGRLVIVGDTHGQLADVLHILHQLGKPSADNRYLFNGDMVDRGGQAVEILLILFSFFLADPTCLIVNRGNHENEDMNALDVDSGGGFSDEVMRKYGLVAYRRFVSAFKAMSLCAVVEKEIFVVHGGLARVKSLSIDYINSIDHTDCTAPHPMATNIKDQIFSDLLWSDPTDQQGKFKSERGIGIKFGPDMTTKFCMQNRLRFVVRSHQVPSDGHGYMKQHEGRCVTIFSASNYCGNGGNYGAVLALASEHFPKYEIYEHYAAPLEEMPRLLGIGDWSGVSAQEYENSQETTSTSRWEKELERMIIAIIEKKPSLWVHVIDMSKGSLMDVEEFEEMMTEMVEGQHPWRDAVHHWGLVNSEGKVDMGKFLGRWVVSLDSEQYAAFLTSAVKHVYQAVLTLDMDLEQTFKLFDRDGDGSVELKEVRQVLGMFDLGLTPSQLDRLTGQIFLAVAGSKGERKDSEPLRVVVQDFLGRFTMVYKTTGEQGSGAMEKWMLEGLAQIGALIMRTPSEDLISELDKAARLIQKTFRGAQARSQVDRLKVGDGDKGAEPEKSPKVGFPRGSQQLAGTKGSLADSKNLTRRDSVPGNKKTEGMPKMVALFSALDVSGDGVLDAEEFVRGIEKVRGIRELQVDGKPLTHDRLVQIAKAIDTTGNGTINYLEFLQAFETSGEGSKDIGDTLGEDITTVLFRHRLAIRMGCLYLDEDSSGKVRGEDFKKVLEGINSVLARPERNITPTQIDLLVDALSSTVSQAEGEDPAEDATIDYDALMRSFVILDTAKDRAVVKHF